MNNPPELYGKPVEVLGTGEHSWLSLEPTPEKADGKVYLPRFQRSLPCGTFVVLQEENAIGRIIGSTYCNVRINVFRFLHDCDHSRYWGFDYSQRPARSTDMNLRNIKGIFQTNELATIGYDDIEDIAFVFKPSLLKRMPFHTQGINNLFSLHCRMGGGVIPVEHCLPFHSSYGNLTTENSIECFPSLIWNHIEEVRVHLMKSLCRTGQRQGQGLVRAYESMFCSPYFIKYLQTRTTELQEWHQIPDRKVKRRKVEAALSRRTVSQVFKGCQLIRFETEAQLHVFCELFGENSIAGSRKRFPKVGTGKLVLKENDCLNVINGVPEADHQEVFSLTTSQPGIDLIFDGRKLYARVRYRSYIYNRDDLEVEEEELDDGPISAMIIALIHSSVNRDIEPPTYGGPTVGTTFSRGESIFEVEVINNGIAVCVDIDNFTSRREYTIEEISLFLAADRA